MQKNPPLIAIAGPTGSGKSHLGLEIAQRFSGEIVNCDSIQVYRYFDIGAAKIPERERRGIPHHLIDVLEPDQVFTAGDYSRQGRRVLHEIAERGHLPVVTGGTGFYLRALIDGLAPGPSRDEELRGRLADREKRRPGLVHRFLRRLDRVTASRIHPNDVPKVIRAVEICLASRRPATEIFSAGRDALEGFRILKIGLFPDRERLYLRLESRLEAMFASGLVEETAAILARGFPASAKPFESIGYKQAVQVVREELSLKDALFYARRDTRRYAKRQMTWFRQESGLEVLRGFGDDPDVVEKALARVGSFLTSAD
ncbi:MAG TPA: tRNA (adenosine(37)-N6)-dimethylallyltransferase MiaA [Bryobacteraceae bacterium]|nr:tRNA (adenosine(37)-N6)-dimethylallyltransferase MiaA [Bryobacteraceae bacterium]